MMRNLRHTKRTSTGMTLIEILVSVLILATGLLGMAALESRSIQFNQNAAFNAQANMLAYDMLDRIRANPIYGIEGPGYVVNIGNIPDSYPTDCDTVMCSPAELAEYDVEQWKFLINSQLPSGDGAIAINNQPEGREYTITVFYDDSKGQQPKRQSILRSVL